MTWSSYTSANTINKGKCREMCSTIATSNRWCDFIDARIPVAQRCDYENSSHFHIIINLKVFSVGVTANMLNASITTSLVESIKCYHCQRIYLWRIQCHLLLWSRRIHLIYDFYFFCLPFHLFHSILLHRINKNLKVKS